MLNPTATIRAGFTCFDSEIDKPTARLQEAPPPTPCPPRWRVAAIMKRDDVRLGIQLVQIFGDILTVPGVAAKAEDQRAIGRAIIRLECRCRPDRCRPTVRDNFSAPGGSGPAEATACVGKISWV